MRFWSKKRVDYLRLSLPKYPSITEVALALSKEFNHKITAYAVQKVSSKNKIPVRQLLKRGGEHSWWNTERVQIAKSVIEDSDNMPMVLSRLQAKFTEKKITEDSLRSAFARQGISLAGLLKAAEAETKNTIWTEAYINKAIDILKKHQTLLEALDEMKKKFDISVTHSGLSGAIKAKFGVTPKQFLATGKIHVTGNSEIVSKLITLIKVKKNKNLSFRELCDEFDLSPAKMDNILAEAKDLGYNIDLSDDGFFLNRDCEVQKVSQKVFAPNISANHFRIAVISDTHLGSDVALVDELQHFVNRAYDDFDVRTILHCGDLLAGEQVYKGQVAELNHWGCAKQCNALSAALPKRKDLQYFAILGNHDVSFTKIAGIDVGRILEASRPDLHCVGALSQRIILNGVEIELAHIKSSAHARSYSLEKHIYRTLALNNHMQVAFCGHRHTNGYFEIQGVHTFLVPCFEDANMFVKYNDFNPSVGGIIVDFFVDDQNNITSISPRFLLYPRHTVENPQISA